MPSMSAKRGPRGDPLQKKIPQNPKYQNVQPTIDTGASITKYMNKIEEIRKNYKFRKDEIFKRMKVTTFAQLVIQVNRIFAMDDLIPDDLSDRPSTVDTELQRLDGSKVEGQADGGSPVPSIALTEGDFGERPPPESSRSTLLSVSRGIGEMDLNAPPPATPAAADSSQPYLLLDVRESDDHSRCHITTALSYPKAILSRAVNYESKEMLAYKNQPGKIIIVYDEDERLAPMAATTLVQRGYDNLFMLSGGLKVAYQLFPEGLINGTLPESIAPRKPVKKGAVPPTPPVPATAHPSKFTLQDIDKIEIYLDNALQDHSIGSRLSKASTTASRTSRASGRSTASTVSQCPPSLAGRPAFR